MAAISQFIGQSRLKPAKVLVFLVLLSIPLCAYYLWLLGLSFVTLHSRLSGASDFELILCGARHFFHDYLPPYQTCAGNNPLSGFLYPPVSILLLAPLAGLPTPIAFMVLSFISLLLLGASLFYIKVLAGDLWPKDHFGKYSLPLLLVSLAPIMQTLTTGHVNLIILAVFVLGLHFAVKQRPVLAAVIIAVGFWLKLYPVFLLAVLIVRRKCRPAVYWTMAWIIVLAALGLLVLGQSTYIIYFSEFLPTLQKYTVPGYSQSITAQWTHINTGLAVQISTGHVDFRAVPLSMVEGLVSKIVLLTGLALAVVPLWRHPTAANLTSLTALAILLLTLLLYSPVAWTHHFVLAIPAIALLLMRLTAGVALSEQFLTAFCWLALAVPGWTQFPQLLLDVPGGYYLAGLFYLRYTLSALLMLAILVFNAGQPHRHQR